MASALALNILPLHAIVRAAFRWLKTMATPVSALSHDSDSSRATTLLSRRDSRGSTWGKVVSVGPLISEREFEFVTGEFKNIFKAKVTSPANREHS